VLPNLLAKAAIAQVMLLSLARLAPFNHAIRQL
jgi:hypothetical protein